MSSDSTEQKKSDTFNLHLATLQLQVKWNLGILNPTHGGNLSLS